MCPWKPPGPREEQLLFQQVFSSRHVSKIMDAAQSFQYDNAWQIFF